MIIAERFTLKGRSLTTRVIEVPHTWHFTAIPSSFTRWLTSSPFPLALNREKGKEDQVVYDCCFSNSD
jgi:hypothetical protein